MLAEILRTAFSPPYQAVHKIPSGSRSAARKSCKGPSDSVSQTASAKELQEPFRLCFPDSFKSELLATPTPYLPTSTVAASYHGQAHNIDDLIWEYADMRIVWIGGFLGPSGDADVFII